jgi:hypothetical protein
MLFQFATFLSPLVVFSVWLGLDFQCSTVWTLELAGIGGPMLDIGLTPEFQCSII